MPIDNEANLAVYSLADSVADYKELWEFYPPEITLLVRLARETRLSRLLEIGIGGGRFTEFLLPLNLDYTGIDYCEPMLEAARERFARRIEANKLHLMDARSMLFSGNSFDAVIWSFNGIDSLDHEARIQALKEIHRILTPNGIFMFASHNAAVLPRMFSRTENTGSPFHSYFLRENIERRISLNSGFGELLKKDHAFFVDGSRKFQLRMYYIKPPYQARQLQEVGFLSPEAYSLTTGKRISIAEAEKDTDQAWIHYWTSKRVNEG